MYIKFTGAVLAVSACLLAGMSCYSDRKKNAQRAETMCHMLKMLCSELETRGATIAEALRAVRPSLHSPADSFANCLSESLKLLAEESFASLWNLALESCLPGLDNELTQILTLPGSIIGRYELSRQLSELDAVIRRLSGKSDSMNEKLPSDRRMALGLSASLGFMLIIVLI